MSATAEFLSVFVKSADTKRVTRDKVLLVVNEKDTNGLSFRQMEDELRIAFVKNNRLVSQMPKKSALNYMYNTWYATLAADVETSADNLHNLYSVVSNGDSEAIDAAMGAIRALPESERQAAFTAFCESGEAQAAKRDKAAAKRDAAKKAADDVQSPDTEDAAEPVLIDPTDVGNLVAILTAATARLESDGYAAADLDALSIALNAATAAGATAWSRIVESAAVPATV